MRKLLFILSVMVVYPAWGMDIPDADSQAAQLFASRCAACHALPHPKRLDWPHWQHMLRVMKQRMHERGMDMTTEEWRVIADYLQTNAR